MAFRYRIVPEVEVFFMELEGEVSSETLHTCIEALRADPLFRPEFGGLIDARRVTNLPLPDELRELAELALASGPTCPTRRAVIVDSDVAFGLARMFEAYSAEGPTRYRPFRQHEAALEWLVGIEPSS
jgi:hypothetical protein